MSTVLNKNEKIVVSTTNNMNFKESIKNPSIDEVRKYIRKIIFQAKEQGKKELVLRSGEIHKELNMKNAMPTVCSAMRTLGSSYKYETLEEPPKGNGSRLVFKYLLTTIN